MGCANNPQTKQFSEVPDKGTSESTVGFTETTANSQTEQFSEVPDTGTSESTVSFTETIPEDTTTADNDTSPAETTTTFDNAAPGFFGIFDGRIMLDGELRRITPLTLMC